MKWGDKDGGYGEQYWDLNHGGAGDNVRSRDRIIILIIRFNVVRNARLQVEYGQYEETTPPEYVQVKRRGDG